MGRKWFEEREQEDMKVGEAAEGEESEVETGDGNGTKEGAAEERGRITEEGTVWDEEMMKLLEEEDKAAWDAILQERC